MDLFIQVLDGNSDNFEYAKQHLTASGFACEDWNQDKPFYYGNGFVCQLLNPIPDVVDEEGNVISYIPGAHINLRTWRENPVAPEETARFLLRTPENPHCIFG